MSQVTCAGVAPASASHAPAFLQTNLASLIAGFVVLHIAVWTFLPIAFTHALPLDLVEGVIWGQGWQLGYDQPPLQAWLLGTVDWLSGYQRWAAYLLSQILVAISLVAVWRLALLIVSPLGALISLLVLDGGIFFNFMTPNLYPDLIELPFWTLAAWSFYRALRWGRLSDWLLLGLWLAGAAYGKYVSAILAVTMIAMMIAEPTARRCWRTPGPYLCGGLCLILLAPHLWWAAHSGFATLVHIQHVSRPTTGLFDWLISLAGFVAGEMAHIAPALLLILALRNPRRGERPIALAGASTKFDRRFVAALALGPVLLMVGVSLLRGIELRVHWGYAMWCFLGLFAVVFLVPEADRAVLRRFGRSWVGVFVAVAVAYATVNSIASRVHSFDIPTVVRLAVPRFMMRRFQEEADFPSREIATTITQRWHAVVGTSLPYLIGRKWIAGNVSFYSPDHPLVLRDGDPARSPWIDMAALADRGAVLLWDAGRNRDSAAATLQRAFPMVEMQPPLLVPWHTSANLPPLRILWGIVLPRGLRRFAAIPPT